MKRHPPRSPIALFLALGLATCTGAEDAPTEGVGFAGLADGWNEVLPENDAICSDGTPYRFYVRPGDPEKVLFFLQGGGACWNGGTCDPDLHPSYNVNLEGSGAPPASGIFDFAEPANPFGEYSVVFAPYCSGDVHIGDSEVKYEGPAAGDHAAHPVLVRHRGGENVQAVLDWTVEHVADPAELFVTGSSAGSIPSPFYAARLARLYPGARVTQLGDGAGGYRGVGEGARPQDVWRTLDVIRTEPGFESIDADGFDFEALYVAAARAHPDITFARYDSAEDSVQLGFLALAEQETPSLLELIRANRDDINAEVDNVRSFIAGGGVHTVLRRPEFYSYRVGSVAFRDWVDALARGENPADVSCVDCAFAETGSGSDSQPFRQR